MKNLILDLKKQNIDIAVVDGNLKLRIPEQIDSAIIVEKIKPLKHELIEYITQREKQFKNQNVIKKAEKREYYPLSYAQKRFFYSEQLYNTNTSYNSTNAYNVTGPLDKVHIRNVIDLLVAKHDIFRTCFFTIDGVPYQKIKDNVEIKLVEYDYKYIDEQSEKEKLIEQTIKIFEKPFDIFDAPLLRFGIIEVKENKRILLFDISHLISDRTTFDLLIRDFILLFYRQSIGINDYTYTDYVMWESKYYLSDEFVEKEKYWLETFKRSIEELKLPLDFCRPQKHDYKGDECFMEIDTVVMDQMLSFTKRYKVTVFMFLLSTFTTFLHKLTRQNDICIGSPYFLRENISIQNMFGILLNTIVFRTFPYPEKTFIQFLDEVRKNSLEVYDNSEYPFELLLEKIEYKRKNNRNPIFDVLFNFQATNNVANKSKTYSKSSEVMFSIINKVSTNAPFDISINPLFSGTGLTIKVQYKTSLFQHSTMSNLVDGWMNLIKQVIEFPNKKLEEYTLFENRVSGRIKIRK